MQDRDADRIAGQVQLAQATLELNEALGYLPPGQATRLASTGVGDELRAYFELVAKLAEQLKPDQYQVMASLPPRVTVAFSWSTADSRKG